MAQDATNKSNPRSFVAIAQEDPERMRKITNKGSHASGRQLEESSRRAKQADRKGHYNGRGG